MKGKIYTYQNKNFVTDPVNQRYTHIYEYEVIEDNNLRILFTYLGDKENPPMFTRCILYKKEIIDSITNQIYVNSSEPNNSQEHVVNMFPYVDVALIPDLFNYQMLNIRPSIISFLN